MLARFSLRLFIKPLSYSFSNSKRLQSLLQKIQVQNDSGKSTTLAESGLIAGQHIDPENSKVTISLNLNKDYRRIKALLKTELESEGFKDVDIQLAPKPKE